MTPKQRAGSPLSGFRPYTARWFRKTFKSPSPIQKQSWPAIRRGESSLLLAPTGSGKTLAAFLCAIDELYTRAEAGALSDDIHVLGYQRVWCKKWVEPRRGSSFSRFISWSEAQGKQA